MARQARGPIEAGRYHVRTRSAGKIQYFKDDIGRTDFCNRVARVATKYEWRCEAFCLMTTHYHLLLDVPENTLQRGMHWLNGTYAQQFNRTHGRWGHLAGARYTITAIGSLRQLRNAFRYIARNPVEAGMCERAQDYFWSSYRGTAGYDEKGFWFVDDRELVSYYGHDRARAQLRLRRFVERDVTDP
jgi:putative transposase